MNTPTPVNRHAAKDLVAQRTRDVDDLRLREPALRRMGRPAEAWLWLLAVLAGLVLGCVAAN